MELAMYHPALGYYAREVRRSGRAGDFFTSVDVGPWFGRALGVQIAECWALMDRPATFDLVEAAAGDGRLMCDVLDSLSARAPTCYESVQVHLVERSSAARSVHADTLSAHAGHLSATAARLPDSIDGVLYANELLDAMPTHALAMTEEGAREIYVSEQHGKLFGTVGPLSSPALGTAMTEAGMSPSPGWRGEISLMAGEWIGELGAAIRSGFAILVDYGHEAPELADARHGAGTLMSYSQHTSHSGLAACLDRPGERDITSHVNLTLVQRAAERADLRTLARVDQTYFLLGVGAAEWMTHDSGDAMADLKRRLALKTLLVPGGLGSTMKVLIFGAGVGTPRLAASSWSARLT